MSIIELATSNQIHNLLGQSRSVRHQFLKSFKFLLFRNQGISPPICLKDHSLSGLFESFLLFLLHELSKFWCPSFRGFKRSRMCQMKGNRSASHFWQGIRWVGSQGVEEILEGVVKNDFVILPGVYRSVLDCNFQRRYFWLTSCCPWM